RTIHQAVREFSDLDERMMEARSPEAINKDLIQTTRQNDQLFFGLGRAVRAGVDLFPGGTTLAQRQSAQQDLEAQDQQTKDEMKSAATRDTLFGEKVKAISSG